MTPLVRFAAVGSLALAGAPLAAQCTSEWLSGPGAPGLNVNGFVYDTVVWDPDGPAPQAPLLVVGGSFVLAGDVATPNIATFDPATGTWAPLGAGLGDTNARQVRAVAVLPGEVLVAAGEFTLSGPD